MTHETWQSSKALMVSVEIRFKTFKGKTPKNLLISLQTTLGILSILVLGVPTMGFEKKG